MAQAAGSSDDCISIVHNDYAWNDALSCNHCGVMAVIFHCSLWCIQVCVCFLLLFFFVVVFFTVEEVWLLI